MEIEIEKSNLNLKIEILFKQKSKFEFYFLFFKKLKIEEQILFKSSLGNVTNQRSAWAKKKFHKKTNRNSFFNFY